MRLRLAAGCASRDAKGELGKLQISPKLMARRDAFLREQERSAGYMDAFLKDVDSRFRGKPVSIMAHIPMLFNVATEGLKRGIENVFAKDTFIMAGGGMKGLTLPEHWRETVDRFFGGAPLSDGYGMTEMVASTRACPHGRYHLPPWQIPFLLDPETGRQYPRSRDANRTVRGVRPQCADLLGRLPHRRRSYPQLGRRYGVRVRPHRTFRSSRNPALLREGRRRRQDHLRRRAGRAR